MLATTCTRACFLLRMRNEGGTCKIACVQERLYMGVIQDGCCGILCSLPWSFSHPWTSLASCMQPPSKHNFWSGVHPQGRKHLPIALTCHCSLLSPSTPGCILLDGFEQLDNADDCIPAPCLATNALLARAMLRRYCGHRSSAACAASARVLPPPTSLMAAAVTPSSWSCSQTRVWAP